jgi:cell division protein FtsQ
MQLLSEVWTRLRRRRGRLVVAGAALLALLVVWLVAFSPVLGVRTVAVRGASGIGVDTVLRAAAVRHGTPLLRLDTAAVASRVEALPDVASAHVTTSLPSTVTITVRARVPVGVVAHGAAYTLVDATGVSYETVSARPPALPLFVLPRGPQVRSTARAMAVVAGQLPAPVLHRVQSVQALDPTSITLLLRGGRMVRWGDATRSADKARLLPVLLQHRSHQIDLTDPDQPVTS